MADATETDEQQEQPATPQPNGYRGITVDVGDPSNSVAEGETVSTTTVRPHSSQPSVPKQYHVFISYRVKTDAALAERVCDKLRNLVVEHAKTAHLRNLNFSVFLDRQELVAGREYTEQFVKALNGSIVFLPIVSKRSMQMMGMLGSDVVDNVLLEWKTALQVHGTGNIDIIPLLVGDSTDGTYRRFFNFSAEHVPAKDAETHRVIDNIFKIQGVFIDPDELTEKLAALAQRFATDIWPRYRHVWTDKDSIAPEPVLACVQCAKPYKASESAPGQCTFHKLKADDNQPNRPPCCGREEPCQRGEHRSRHHTDYRYSGYFDWILNLVENEQREEFCDVNVPDHRTYYKAQVVVGSIRPEHPTEGGKTYVFVSVGPMDSWVFKLFTKAEIEAIDPDSGTVIAETSTTYDDLIGPAVAKATWIFDERRVVGIEVFAKTFSVDMPTIQQLFLTWLDAGGASLSKVVPVSTARFGERALPHSPSQSYPNLPSGVFTRNFAPMPVPVPRLSDHSFKCERRGGSKLGATLKSSKNYTPFRSKMERFLCEVLLENLGGEECCISTVNAFWRMREKGTWTPVDDVMITKADGRSDKKDAEFLPCFVKGRGATSAVVSVDVVKPRDIQTITLIGPIMIDLVFNIVGGSSTTITFEQCVEPKYLQGLEWSPPGASSSSNGVAIRSLYVDNPIKNTRCACTIEVFPPASDNESDPEILAIRASSMRLSLQLSTLRRALLTALEAPATDERRLFQRLKTTTNSGEFEMAADALIDYDCRRVYAVKFSLRAKEQGNQIPETVTFVHVPQYGDALTGTSVGVPMEIKSIADDVVGWGEQVDAPTVEQFDGEWERRLPPPAAEEGTTAAAGVGVVGGGILEAMEEILNRRFDTLLARMDKLEQRLDGARTSPEGEAVRRETGALSAVEPIARLATDRGGSSLPSPVSAFGGNVPGHVGGGGDVEAAMARIEAGLAALSGVDESRTGERIASMVEARVSLAMEKAIATVGPESESPEPATDALIAKISAALESKISLAMEAALSTATQASSPTGRTSVDEIVYKIIAALPARRSADEIVSQVTTTLEAKIAAAMDKAISMAGNPTANLNVDVAEAVEAMSASLEHRISGFLHNLLAGTRPLAHSGPAVVGTAVVLLKTAPPQKPSIVPFVDQITQNVIPVVPLTYPNRRPVGTTLVPLRTTQPAPLIASLPTAPTLENRLDSFETRLETLPASFKLTLHTALESHADLISALLKMQIEQRISHLEENAVFTPRRRAESQPLGGVIGGMWGVVRPGAKEEALGSVDENVGPAVPNKPGQGKGWW